MLKKKNGPKFAYGYLLLLPFAFSIFFAGGSSPKVRAESPGQYTTSAEFFTDVTNWCTTEVRGTRRWKLEATYNPTDRTLSGKVVFTNTGDQASGQNKAYLYVDSFDIFDIDGNQIATLPCSLLNQPSGDYSFATITLPTDPYLVKVSGQNYRSPGICPPGPFQDDYSLPFNQLATNPYFNVPCPVITTFQITPNPVPPGGSVTADWVVENLFIGRKIRITGPGFPSGDRTDATGSQVFTAPATIGNYTYTLSIIERDGTTQVACVTPRTVTLVVGGANFFWLVKRQQIAGELYPPGSPPFYVEPPVGTAPPGSNDSGSFRRVPETGFFQATSFSQAQTMFITERNTARIQMIASDQFFPGGARSPNYLAARNDFLVGVNQLYPNAVNRFNSQNPGYAGPILGVGLPENLSTPKRNERVDPYEN